MAGIQYQLLLISANINSGWVDFSEVLQDTNRRGRVTALFPPEPDAIPPI